MQSTLKDMGFILPDPTSLTLDLTQFRQDFRKSWKNPVIPATRGSFIVRGRVEVCGSRGRAVVIMVALYDPKLGRYVSFPYIGEEYAIPNSQAPRGGP